MAKNIVKSVDYQIKEYIKKISDDDLKWLSIRFKERLGSDIPEALVFIQENHNDINKILSNMPSANAVYDTVDIIDKAVQEELKKRTIINHRPVKVV